MTKVEPIYPPRPKGKMASANLPIYEKTGKWCAQRKFNGQRTIIFISENREITFFGRECQKHRNFSPTKDLLSQIRSLNFEEGKSYWLDGEILDNKTKDPAYKDRVILFDVLQEGQYLFGGPNLLERLEILNRICRNPTELEPHRGIALKVTDNIWMAETFFSDFKNRFSDKLQLDEIEGLVLKKKDSVIDSTGHRYYETTWLVRCRKPTKNYNS